MSFETTVEDDLVVQGLEPTGLVRMLKEYAERSGYEPWDYIRRAMEDLAP